ncbi:MAG: anhydro-N-acetylmuramic acid kinase [Bacteroidota bacterium]
MNKYRVIGVMSGSSMDGVDLAYCEFELVNTTWEYKIVAAQTIPYDEKWRVRLSQLYKQPIEIYPKTDAFYGRYLGQLVKKFVQEYKLTVDFVASHGHTIFHQPEQGFTAQIGCGAGLNAESGLPVVTNFRNIDVMLGGQGAPLVPIGDKFLFTEYDACLNLGGISNISFNSQQGITAFDISPCNIVLNRVARWLKLPFDDGGKIAASAEVDTELLSELNEIPFYQKKGAKSLGREWINTSFWPIVKNYLDTSEPEKMATLVEHIATQIADVLNHYNIQKILVTGGGAFNTFLIETLQKKTSCQIVIPEATLVNYKEALIFAFLGILRLRNENNILSSVTGASRDSIGGALHGNFNTII